MQVQWGSASDAGGRRRMNEDAAFARHPVFVVADGMGGHARGEMASRTVAAAFARLADQPTPVTPADVTAAVRAGADQIRRTMEEETRLGWTTGDPQDAMAGSTVSGVILTEQDGEPYWLVLNVGDSRVYRLGQDGLQQISVDHSLVQEMVDAGEIDAEEAQHHPRRNVITRAVGTGTDVEVDYWMLRVRPDDRLLACTDGLFGELEEDEIAEVLGSGLHPTAAAEELVERAVAGGARDNITVVVVDVAVDEDVETTAASSPDRAVAPFLLPAPGGPDDVDAPNGVDEEPAAAEQEPHIIGTGSQPAATSTES